MVKNISGLHNDSTNQNKEIEALKKRCHEAEATLKAMEERNRLLGDSAPFGILATDLEGNLIGMNSRMRNMLPWPEDKPEESVNIYEFQPLIDAGADRDIRRCLRINQSIIRDYSCQDTRQDCLELRFYISPVADSGGSVSGAMIFVENLTSLKMAETAAEESERRYHLLFQSAPVAMIERDASQLKGYLTQLHQSGVSDLNHYLQEYPEETVHCMSLIKTVDCNDAFYDLFEVRDKNIQMSDFPMIASGGDFHEMAKEVILMVDQGTLKHERERTLHTLTGKKKNVLVRALILAGHEDTLSRIVISFVDITKRKKAEEKVRTSERKFREQSMRDALTSLYNQRFLYQSLAELIESAEQNKTDLSLLFMDLDNFKQVVDTHGHLNGSYAIQEVASTISSTLAPPAYAVAYAGDEFVVVLPDTNQDQAAEKAAHIQTQIKATEYLTGKGISVTLQASCGIATFPEHAGDVNSLLAAADHALFSIKKAGKGAIGYFDNIKQQLI
jgi:diguanylate cyclase (GGDEF)-like protein